MKKVIAVGPVPAQLIPPVINTSAEQGFEYVDSVFHGQAVSGTIQKNVLSLHYVLLSKEFEGAPTAPDLSSLGMEQKT